MAIAINIVIPYFRIYSSPILIITCTILTYKKNIEKQELIQCVTKLFCLKYPIVL